MGPNHFALERQTRQTGLKYYGNGLHVAYYAAGTGDISKCKFKRTVIDYTWETQNGVKVVVDDDKGQEKPDGPLTTPQNPRGFPGSGIEVRGNQWLYTDIDIPSYGLVKEKLPGGKKATYRFTISDIATGMVLVDKSWTLTIDIDANGNVKMNPNAKGILAQ